MLGLAEAMHLVRLKDDGASLKGTAEVAWLLIQHEELKVLLALPDQARLLKYSEPLRLGIYIQYAHSRLEDGDTLSRARSFHGITFDEKRIRSLILKCPGMKSERKHYLFEIMKVLDAHHPVPLFAVELTPAVMARIGMSVAHRPNLRIHGGSLTPLKAMVVVTV